MTIQRAYYHCAPCADGVIPKDQDLDIAATTFSPGVRRLLGRVGGKEAFDAGRQDLAALAGIAVTTKAVERVAEALGAQVEAVACTEREAALAGKLVPLQPAPKLYIALDATGVPVVPRETVGRSGKDETGQAKTREAKLGCVFTQTRRDETGHPVRDPDSTTYVGAIESAEAFGRRLYAEAVRRGVQRAAQVIVLGDGAPWRGESEVRRQIPGPRTPLRRTAHQAMPIGSASGSRIAPGRWRISSSSSLRTLAYAGSSKRLTISSGSLTRSYSSPDPDPSSKVHL